MIAGLSPADGGTGAFTASTSAPADRMAVVSSRSSASVVTPTPSTTHPGPSCAGAPGAWMAMSVSGPPLPVPSWTRRSSAGPMLSTS